MLIQTTPGGFDNFFAECAEEFAKGGPPDMDKLIEISAKYNIFYGVAAAMLLFMWYSWIGKEIFKLILHNIYLIHYMVSFSMLF